ncbi:hypothetical protein [Streptomyces collinus]|uniref:hypothetical protein n=1 Tax=Streptomyces collinus TaxID=42684 RepID=UPI0036368562
MHRPACPASRSGRGPSPVVALLTALAALAAILLALAGADVGVDAGVGAGVGAGVDAHVTTPNASRYDGPSADDGRATACAARVAVRHPHGDQPPPRDPLAPGSAHPLVAPWWPVPHPAPADRSPSPAPHHRTARGRAPPAASGT